MGCLGFPQVLRQACAWNRFWRDFLKVWGVPKQTSYKFASEGFRVEMSTPRQLLRSLGPLPETSARTTQELPRSPSKNFSSREAGREIVIFQTRKGTPCAVIPTPPQNFCEAMVTESPLLRNTLCGPVEERKQKGVFFFL